MAIERVMTILGTRPEIIRLSGIIGKLDRHCEHILVHTGQNYDRLLSDIFLEELEVRQPDVFLGARSTSFSGQIGQILERVESIILQRRPTRVLILGDTNSGLAALVARRMGIPVYHMEAGNRCFDDRVPEEVNRRVIDHSSSVLMPYTMRSRENLLREGIPGERIYVTGNPIKEVIDAHWPKVERSDVVARLGLSPRGYFLVTLHRAENVDIESRLCGFVEGLARIRATHDMPVVCSVHPRTRAKVEAFGIKPDELGLRFLEPFGFFDFVRLERDAACILSDSGTVQEEACILKVPNVTLRDVTERPETLECGSNLLSGGEPTQIVAAVDQALSSGATWTPPAEYLAANVADIVVRIVLGYRIADLAEQGWRASAARQSNNAPQ